MFLGPTQHNDVIFKVLTGALNKITPEIVAISYDVVGGSQINILIVYLKEGNSRLQLEKLGKALKVNLEDYSVKIYEQEILNDEFRAGGFRTLSTVSFLRNRNI